MFWSPLGMSLSGGWGRWSFPSTQNCWVLSPVLSSLEQEIWTSWSKSLWLLRWWRDWIDWIIYCMRRGWEIWACSAWRRGGWEWIQTFLCGVHWQYVMGKKNGIPYELKKILIYGVSGETLEKVLERSCEVPICGNINLTGTWAICCMWSYMSAVLN